MTRRLAGAAVAVAFMVGGAAITQAQVVYPDQEQGEDYHVVRDGDTLWDLSGRFYGDTYQWPRLWSYNSHITNPHWIYPGDIVYRSQPPSRGAAAAGDEGDEQQADSGSSERQEEAQEGLYLPLGGYMTPGEPRYVGRIVASPKEARMLAQYDDAWVGWGDDAYTEREQQEIKKRDRLDIQDPEEVNKGDRFAIVRQIGELTDGNRVIARKYWVIGAVEVTDTNENEYDEVRITQSWSEIERGDALIPYERQLRNIKQEKATGDQVAEIVDTLMARSIFGEHNYVFIDKGAADGVRPGNRFFIYQHYEGLHKEDVHGPVDEKVPWSRVGQVLVIDAKEEYSTAIVTDSEREIVKGDRLEMYDGY